MHLLSPKGRAMGDRFAVCSLARSDPLARANRWGVSFALCVATGVEFSWVEKQTRVSNKFQLLGARGAFIGGTSSRSSR